MSDEKGRRVVLRAIVKQGADKEKAGAAAKAEHLAAHPEDANCEFDYIIHEIAEPPEELQECSPLAQGSRTARKTARGLVTWDDLAITLEDGRVLSGTYGYSDRYVTVKTAKGSKMSRIGSAHPRALAHIMLRELAGEGKA